MRCGVSDADLRVSGGGEKGRDLGLNSENPLSFSFSFSRPRSLTCCADSENCVADGETVGETASNLPSSNDGEELRLFDASLSFLRGKTLERNAAITSRNTGGRAEERGAAEGPDVRRRGIRRRRGQEGRSRFSRPPTTLPRTANA